MNHEVETLSLVKCRGAESKVVSRAMKSEFTRSKSFKSFLAFAVCTFLICSVGYGFDRLLLKEGVPRFDVLLLANLLTGCVVAVLFLQTRSRTREKERLLEQRLETIAVMNHHVRNALQVVAYYGYQHDDVKAGRLVNESIARIEWTLKEVLPRGWDLGPQPEETATSRTDSGDADKSRITA
jgi:hypothetical protein